MGTSLVPPADAAESLPGTPGLYGDPYDDDAQIMDELMQDHAEPPAPGELPKTIKPLAETVTKPQPITRIMSRTLTIPVTPVWDAVLLAPADARRVNLTLYGSSDTATNFIRWSDDPGKVQSVQGSSRLYSGQLLNFASGTHTGPIWVYAPDIATSPFNVFLTAITQ